MNDFILQSLFRYILNDYTLFVHLSIRISNRNVGLLHEIVVSFAHSEILDQAEGVRAVMLIRNLHFSSLVNTNFYFLLWVNGENQIVDAWVELILDYFEGILVETVRGFENHNFFWRCHICQAISIPIEDPAYISVCVLNPREGLLSGNDRYIYS